MSEKEKLERAYNAWTAVVHYEISLRPLRNGWRAFSAKNASGEPSKITSSAWGNTPVEAVEELCGLLPLDGLVPVTPPKLHTK